MRERERGRNRKLLKVELYNLYPIKYYYDEQIKEEGMGVACRTFGT
jgi:hypothetical protein